LSIFLLGFFWKKATANGALTAAVLSIALSAVIANMYPEFPFLNRMGVVFWICSLIHIIISLIESKGKDQESAFEVRKEWFKVEKPFAIGAFVVCAIFTIIFVIFW
jgi:SSS family solute:Na+ symporter